MTGTDDDLHWLAAVVGRATDNVAAGGGPFAAWPAKADRVDY